MWAPVEQLLDALHRDEKWVDVRETDLHDIIEQSEKKRFEIRNGKIKAFYGHSIPMKILKEEKMLPDLLYHGTARRFLESIKAKGLLPQSRQYVHLSKDIETAENVGRRHNGKPCILIIDATSAWNEGVKFYPGNEKVWLADAIPGRFIKIYNKPPR